MVAIDCRNITSSEEVSATLQANSSGGTSLNYINSIVYDARGNGDGKHASTITGDHEGRVSDYSHVVCFPMQKFGQYKADGSPTRSVMARDYKDATDLVVSDGNPPRRYIVRRLTPTECQRLQGFQDGYGVPDEKRDMDDAEAKFWESMRRTHAEATGKRYSPCKNRAALIKWYNGLHNDSAEYKMWGNGIALPCAAFVLEGVAEEMEAADEKVGGINVLPEMRRSDQGNQQQGSGT